MISARQWPDTVSGEFIESKTKRRKEGNKKFEDLKYAAAEHNTECTSCGRGSCFDPVFKLALDVAEEVLEEVLEENNPGRSLRFVLANVD